MLLEVIPMICFEFLRILEKNHKKGKPKNLGKHGLLRHSVRNPRRGVAQRRSVGCLAEGEAKVPKRAPLGYAMGRKFLDFVSKALYSHTDSLRTLIND